MAELTCVGVFLIRTEPPGAVVLFHLVPEHAFSADKPVCLTASSSPSDFSILVS